MSHRNTLNFAFVMTIFVASQLTGLSQSPQSNNYNKAEIGLSDESCSNFSVSAFAHFDPCGEGDNDAIGIVMGGAKPYQVSWYHEYEEGKDSLVNIESESFKRGNVVRGIGLGMYRVVVTDSKGCSSFDKLELTSDNERAENLLRINESKDKIYLDKTRKDDLYIWTKDNEVLPEEDQAHLIINEPGKYSVQVIKAVGCSKTFELEVGEEDQPASDCAFELLISDSFDRNWGNWNDGGSDAARLKLGGRNPGSAIRLRDNSGIASSIYTDNLDLSHTNYIKVSFGLSVKNLSKGESLILEYSIDQGASFNGLDQWEVGTRISNDKEYSISNEYAVSDMNENVMIRFRSAASSNRDLIYLDNVEISHCENEVGIKEAELAKSRSSENNELSTPEISYSVYPNPTTRWIKVDLGSNAKLASHIQVYSATGELLVEKRILDEKNNIKIDFEDLPSGVYFLKVDSSDKLQKIIKQV